MASESIMHNVKVCAGHEEKLTEKYERGKKKRMNENDFDFE